ncbi:MAG: hypothetical protein JF622_16780, partial [Terrabacter sp.]|nr:hypothetical protein [Terrabacter sp.]
DGHQAIVVSPDDGKTWTIRTIPNSTPSDADPAVAVGDNGTVYVGYVNGDGTPHVATSHDRGASFATDYNVGASLGLKNTVFPTAVAGDDNRSAVSFIATTTAGNYQDAANFTGIWHLYTAFTYDGGSSFTTVDDTPNDPVQRGSICTGGTTCGQDRNLLDFIGSTADSNGRVEVAYADGCTGACVTGTTNNFDAYATIARQTSGLTLRAAFDPQPNLTASKVSAAVATNGKSSLTATMTNTGTAAATAPLRLLVDGTPLSTSTARTLAPGASIVITAPWTTSGLKKGSTHTVTAVADPLNVVAESNESDNRATVTVRV